MNETQIIYGIHAVNAIIQSAPKRILQLYYQENTKNNRVRELLLIANEHNVATSPTSARELTAICNAEHHQGIAVQATEAATLNESAISEILESLTHPALILLLDGVQDPHNLGACLRSADAAGVDMVIAPKDKSVSLTSTVRKVACGAAETVPFIQVTNLARTMRDLQQQNIWIMGTAADAEQTIFQGDFTGATAFVLGGEAKGMRRLTREHCDALLSIPMKGTVESLNVSVATAVCLFEASRQRT